jgi:hypothetical protein
MYAAAPGNEIVSGKFLSPQSSAALVANTFGFFLNKPSDLPPLPGTGDQGWPARSMELEAVVRFPWSGGRHPCLDVLVRTSAALVGIEAKRFEPYRTKNSPALSEAYWRPVWGDAMSGYQTVRDKIRDGTLKFVHLDAAQLMKHAFGLRTATQRTPSAKPLLFYLYAEPAEWPDGAKISTSQIETHRSEFRAFAELVRADEVKFHSCTYRDLLRAWSQTNDPAIQAHAAAVLERFGP